MKPNLKHTIEITTAILGFLGVVGIENIISVVRPEPVNFIYQSTYEKSLLHNFEKSIKDSLKKFEDHIKENPENKESTYLLNFLRQSSKGLP